MHPGDPLRRVTPRGGSGRRGWCAVVGLSTAGGGAQPRRLRTPACPLNRSRPLMATTSCTNLRAQAGLRLITAFRRGQPTTAHHPRPPDPPRGITRRKGSPGVHGWPSGAKDRTTRPSRGPQLDPRAGRCCCSQLRRTRIAAQQHQASSPRAATGQSGAPGTSLGPWTPLEWPSGAGKGRAPLIVGFTCA